MSTPVRGFSHVHRVYPGGGPAVGGSPAYLTDDMVHLIRLKNDALQRAGFARFHSFVQSWRVASEGISQVTGMPPLFQNVLKIIPFL